MLAILFLLYKVMELHMICKRHEIKTGGQLSYQEMRVISNVTLHAEHNSFVKIPTNKVTCELELELMVLLLQVM